MKTSIVVFTLLFAPYCAEGFTSPHKSATVFGTPIGQAKLRSRAGDVPRALCRHDLRLSVASRDPLRETGPYWDGIRVGAAVSYVALLSFAFVFAPGQAGGPEDKALLDQILADPINPGINAIYYTLFNLFTTMPVILAAIVCPQASKNGLPPAPFILGSALLGFFTAGPYLLFRKPPLKEVTQADLGWFTRNVLENNFFGFLTVVVTVLAVLAPNALGAYQADPAGTWQGFVDLMTTSRFCSVSGLDLTILYGFMVSLTPRDYMLRKPDATKSEVLRVAALSALFPFLGSAIYMTLRPSLPED